MKSLFTAWQFWAAMSAVFAALTAIFGKIGVQDINSDFATFLRTIVVLVVLGLIVALTGAWQPLGEVSRTSKVDLRCLAVMTNLRVVEPLAISSTLAV